MRKELELIEKIERYLNMELTANEKVEFEEHMATDPGLREEVRLQMEIMKGVERFALRESLHQKRIRSRRGRRFTQWGSAGIVVLVFVAAILYYKHNDDLASGYQGKILPKYNELGDTTWADADKNLEAQIFEINASDDTVIETKGGLVLSLPANGFLDEDGRVAQDKFELIVKEALDPASIIKAGLSSKSGTQLLESGGMFFVDARKDEKMLKINPSKRIYAEVPTDTVRGGMKLFRGKRQSDGTIDWVSPSSLEHDLLPVDIQSLDFYPPHYLDSLARWGYDIRDKKFTDSLYYSFAWMFSKSGREEIEKKEYQESGYIAEAYGGVHDSIQDTSLGPYWAACGINPAKIKTIWRATYQNTLLSTREFEERIPWIHKIGLGVLDLYVSNLDKDLCTIDSMAAVDCGEATGIRDRFYTFAARGDRKVKNGNRQFEKLREYYRSKTKAFTEAISKTQQEFWDQARALDRQAGRRRMVHENDSNSRMRLNFLEEFNLNLKEAYRQLGYDTAQLPLPRTGEVYRIQVISMGWCNVDRYVSESVLNRVSLNFTDSQTGRKAVINYLAVSFQIEKANNFDRLYLYLLPDNLSSFMRLAGKDGKYVGELDELMKYKLICVGFKGDQSFFYSQGDIQSKEYAPVGLREIGKEELNRELDKAGSRMQGSGLRSENDFFQFEIRDQNRLKRNAGLLELRQQVQALIFPCYGEK